MPLAITSISIGGTNASEFAQTSNCGVSQAVNGSCTSCHDTPNVGNHSVPLAINIGDLTWSDYDPDGEPVFFVGVSDRTSNGLALAIQGTQILVPANSMADGFSYTIADDRGVTTNGTAKISIITNVTSRALSLGLAPDGSATINWTGVPWYSYECQRATNVTFTGTLATANHPPTFVSGPKSEAPRRWLAAITLLPPAAE